MACLRICDFYNGVIVFCQRVRVKKNTGGKSWAAKLQCAVLYNKDPLYPPRDTLQHNYKNSHFPSSLHAECDKGLLARSRAFCLLMSLSVFCSFLFFFFSIQVKSCDRDEHPFYFGWKEGWKAESHWVCPSWYWRRGSPPGDELTHRPAAGTCKLGSLRNTRLGCLQARPRLDVSVGACMCAPMRIYNEAELTGQINLNH